MNIVEAIKNRHSVRDYSDNVIESEKVEELKKEIEKCNNEGDLHIQLVTNEPDAFGGFMAHYGKFNNVKNYIALIGKKGKDLDEKIGYFGERLAIKSGTLGLNTCWVAMTYNKKKAKVNILKGEKMVCVLALGYGNTNGIQHKSKPIDAVCNLTNDTPEWFKNGVELALLAPTAMNQQKFYFSLENNTVFAKAGSGFYTKVDLGIVKYHFEIGASNFNFNWK